MVNNKYPISNIKSAQAAKTITIARKNFMFEDFADTEADAEVSDRVFSMIETSRANGHNSQQYLSVLLAELPNVTTAEQIDTLLPWVITPDEITERYAAFPTP